MSRSLIFLAGLPRSGTTLLGSILAQNPAFHVSATSPLPTLLQAAAQAYHGSEQTIAHSVTGQCAAVLNGIIDGLYRHVGADKIIIDKSRAWQAPAAIRIIEEVIGCEARIICPVRPIAEILASFVALMERNGGRSLIEREMHAIGMPITHKARCQYLMSPNGVVRVAYECLKAAFDDPDLRRRLLLIDYEQICSAPDHVMADVYRFIGVDPFAHRFDDVVGAAVEDDDAAYGLPGLHCIRSKVARASPEPSAILGEKLCAFYQGGEFWSEKPEPAPVKKIIDLQLEASLRGDFDLGWSLCQMAEPSDDRAMFNKGWFLLRQGKLCEGMQHLDRGRGEGVFGGAVPSCRPRYDGRHLRGETVLLNSEGGLGDAICNARFARDIAARGGRVVLACDAGLAPILSQVPGVSAVVESAAAGGVFHHYWSPAMSAAGDLGLEYRDLDGSPYLPGPQSERAAWRGNVPIIGLRWAGNPQFEHEQHRRFDPSPLFDLPGELISLQTDWAEPIPACVRQPSLRTWEDTAVQINRCDLIISSCTAVAHLAAAMGKPTWIIVPVLPYYLWALPGDGSPWYDSVRLFRQEQYGDWSAPFDKLRGALCEFTEHHTMKEIAA